MPSSRLPRYAWGVTAFTVAVVLWGAFVRASGAGAGCGAHWPLCNGEIVPRAPALETLIELTHRVTSGAILIGIVALAVWVWRALPAGHPARPAAVASVVFVLTEALIGAGLVLFGLVADDHSPERAVVLGVHLANTFVLLAVLALTAHWSARPGLRGIPWRASRTAAESALALVGLLAVGVTGAVTALGDTLFPATSLAEGLRHDLTPGAHVLIRLRVWHPLLALAVGAGVAAHATAVRRRFGAAVVPVTGAVTTLIVTQIVVGVANLALLAPVWAQLLHLLLADALWIAVVVLWATAAETETARGEKPARATKESVVARRLVS